MPFFHDVSDKRKIAITATDRLREPWRHSCNGNGKRLAVVAQIGGLEGEGRKWSKRKRKRSKRRKSNKTGGLEDVVF